jgi:hypothetical protein
MFPFLLEKPRVIASQAPYVLKQQEILVIQISKTTRYRFPFDSGGGPGGRVNAVPAPRSMTPLIAEVAGLFT